MGFFWRVCQEVFFCLVGCFRFFGEGCVVSGFLGFVWRELFCCVEGGLAVWKVFVVNEFLSNEWLTKIMIPES